MDFANKTIIVTGGASGIGAETVRMLRAAGAEVLAVDRDACSGLAGDVADPALVAPYAAEFVRRRDESVTPQGLPCD